MIDWADAVPEIPGARIETFHPPASGLTVVTGTFTTGSISRYADGLRQAGFVDVTDTGIDDAVLTDRTITIRLLLVQPDAFNIIPVRLQLPVVAGVQLWLRRSGTVGGRR